MKDPNRRPTTLERLQQIANEMETWHADEGVLPESDVFDEAIQWINWTLAHLEGTKQYHKKRQLKLSIMKRMAETLLSEDELAQVDAEAERQISQVDQVEEEVPE
jgi:hypothetical protein